MMIARTYKVLSNTQRRILFVSLKNDLGLQPIQQRRRRGAFEFVQNGAVQSPSPYTRVWFSSSSSSSSSQHSKDPPPQPNYRVAKISDSGELNFADIPIRDVLRTFSTIHARDLFNLALTTTTTNTTNTNNTNNHSNTAENEPSEGPPFRIRRKQYIAAGRRKTASYAFRRAPPAILPRGDEVLMTFGNIRAIIGRNSGMIFNAHKPTVQVLAKEIASSLKTKLTSDYHQDPHTNQNNDDITTRTTTTDYNNDPSSSSSSTTTTTTSEPFELMFIEEILRDACDTYDRRLVIYEPIVDSLLSRVSNEILSDSGVHRLVPIKDSLQEFEMIVKEGLDCIAHVLDNDDDMLNLLLTEQEQARKSGIPIQHVRHETVELLFEEYARRLSHVLKEVDYLLRRVQSKQELVSLSLDAYRNRMIRMNVYLAMASVGLATSTTVAGYFGMNLIHGLESSPLAFTYIVTGTTAMGVIFFGICASYLSGSIMKRRAQQRLDEIETISAMLGDMPSIDFAVKAMVDSGKPMDKPTLSKKLLECKNNHNNNNNNNDNNNNNNIVIVDDDMNEKEIDLIFEILDVSRNGLLYTDDFRFVQKNVDKEQ